MAILDKILIFFLIQSLSCLIIGVCIEHLEIVHEDMIAIPHNGVDVVAPVAKLPENAGMKGLCFSNCYGSFGKPNSSETAASGR